MKQQVQDRVYFKLQYGSIDKMIEQLNKVKEEGFTNIRQGFYGHNGEFDLVKCKMRDETDKEESERLKKVEDNKLKKERLLQTKIKECERLKKELGVK